MGRPVDDAADAWAAACEIGIEGGYAVVVKPQDGNQGKGVAVNLTTRAQVEAAYAVAVKISDEVLVERYLPGQDYRILVIGNKLVASIRQADASQIDNAALLFVLARIAHGLFYIADLARPRSLAWLIGLGCVVYLFGLAAGMAWLHPLDSLQSAVSAAR